MATFAVTLPACIHVPDNTRLTATYSEKYSVADVFREIHKEIPEIGNQKSERNRR
jgi:hypothetical protein